jgi:hypothetical protein
MLCSSCTRPRPGDDARAGGEGARAAAVGSARALADAAAAAAASSASRLMMRRGMPEDAAGDVRAGCCRAPEGGDTAGRCARHDADKLGMRTSLCAASAGRTGGVSTVLAAAAAAAAADRN